MEINKNELISLISTVMNDIIILKTMSEKKGVLKTSTNFVDLDFNYYKEKKKIFIEENSNMPKNTSKVKGGSWGVRIGKSPFIFHKDNIYLEFLIVKSIDREYKDMESGNVMTLEEAYEKMGSKNKNEDKRTVRMRRVNINNIISFQINEEEYTVADY